MFVAATWAPEDPERYSYLLGLYLGDGTLMEFPRSRSPTLRLYLDAAYEGIVDEAASAIRVVAPTATVRRYGHRPGLTILHATDARWRLALPQHGPGKKHLRAIVLEPWQEVLTTAYPRSLIRGLIHSDGSRCMNRFSTKLPSGRVAQYEYPRYFFTNYSADIRRIFCRHCELLGIRWTQSSFKNISISHRKSVALLDEFVGPKE